MSRNRRGFTLVELLVVVAIIGVLAAIALPRFSNTKDKAKLAALKSDVRNTETAEETYFADFGMYGTFAQVQASGLLKLSPATSMTLTGTATGYTVNATDATVSAGVNSCSVQVGTGAASTLDGVVTCP